MPKGKKAGHGADGGYPPAGGGTPPAGGGTPPAGGGGIGQLFVNTISIGTDITLVLNNGRVVSGTYLGTINGLITVRQITIGRPVVSVNPNTIQSYSTP